MAEAVIYAGGGMSERVWWTRLRWRLRGATMWPAFVPAVLVDAVLLHELPIAGDSAPEPFGAVLLAFFFNLVAVAIGAPLAGRWLRRRRPALPRVVADDRAGTVLLGLLCGGLAILGLAHRPAMQAGERAFEAQAVAARRSVLNQAPPEFRANVGRMDTWQPGPGLYRTCVPGPDPRRSFCVIVDTDQRPPGVRRDPNQSPNSVVAGPDNPARRGR
jgi:hypothetical protein